LFATTARYLPLLPPGIAPPGQWGEPGIVRERLGAMVTGLVFDRAVMQVGTLSPQHIRGFSEQNIGPVMRVVQALTNEPARLAEFRRELEELIALYFYPDENVLRQDYLLSRATKA
jgi:hypothetical protein